MYQLAAVVAAAGFAHRVGLAVSEASNPVRRSSHLHPTPPHLTGVQTLHEFWKAAHAGDDATVSSMLREHSIPANTQHHISGASLVIEIAEIAANTNAQDRGLAAVLRVLAQHGWTLARKSRITNYTPLHILAFHSKRVYIAHRLKLLLSEDFLQPAQHSMLVARDWVKQLPEEKAAETGDDCRGLREVLRQARLAPQLAEQQRMQGKGGHGCVTVPLLLPPGDEASAAAPLQLRFVRLGVSEGETARTDVVVEEVP
eukprot:jgi/Ulvmu1/7403/UM036_0063.1